MSNTNNFNPLIIPQTNEAIQDFLGFYFGQEKFSGDLQRVQFLADKFDLLDIPVDKVITIAGTNGKGQVTRELSEVLTSQGYFVCRFTSPHYLEVRERMWAGGQFIENKELGILCFQMMEKLKLLKLDQCSFFEFIFLVFLTWVKKLNYDYLLLEVGLGGRLDATKVVPAGHVLLTSISRDHVAILGHSFKSILYEKLGILSHQSILYYSLELNYLKELTQKYLKDKKIIGFELKTKSDDGKSGLFFENNRALIIFFWELLFKKKFPQYLWKESQFFYQAKIKTCEFYFFPSHNLDGIRKLFQFLKQKNYNQRSPEEKLQFDATFMGFSQRPLWEVDSILKLVCHNKAQLGEIGLSSFDHEKCFKDFHLLSSSAAQQFFCQHYQHYFPESFFIEPKRILVFGSNYFIGELRKYLGA
jgi:dihydrofolate synthase/folylpolyglutamate synthase